MEFTGNPTSQNNYTNVDAIEIRHRNSTEYIKQRWEHISELISDPETDEDVKSILAEELDSLSIQSAIAECSKCSLRRCCKGPVSFDGSRDASGRGFSIVGLMAAPSAEDDDNETPISGPQRKLLESACLKIGLKIDAYVSPVCCRTPQNRQPTAEEIKSCRSNLVAQIEYLDPWLILCFGAAAMTALNPELKISVDHGVFFPVIFLELGNKTIWAYGIAHPYYVLNANKKTPNDELLRKQFSDDMRHVSLCIKAYAEYGGEVLHPLMDVIRKESPYIPNNKKKTEKLKQTYLQKLEDAEDERAERKIGKEVSADTKYILKGSDEDDIPF
jgi:uracil-DNA glycosylase family 4